MNSLTIYHGTTTPIKAIGKHQVKLLDFAYRYPQWHTYSTDRNTLRALKSLQSKCCLLVNEYNQFRFTYPTM